MIDLLAKIARAGVHLELHGDELRVIDPMHALTPELREALRSRKPEILDRLRRMAPVSQTEPLPELLPAHTECGQPFPLTDVQHAYWMGRRNLVELGRIATHFYLELDCDGIEVGRLNAAFQRMIERHDMLRAVIDADGLQRILPEVPQFRIAAQDVSAFDAAAAEAAMMETRETMSHEVRPADRWPLFDVRATLLAGKRIRLHISLDMLTMDAWSMFVLFREWHQAYEDPGCPLPEIGISYRDYVLAERRLVGSKAYAKARRYWEDRIDALPGAPELPIMGAGIKMDEAPRFTRRTVRIEKTLWSQLKARARDAGLTSSGLLLAAYAEVLTRWSVTPHYTLNLTLFNRLPLHPHVSRIVGDFTSLTMLEVDHRDRSRSFRSRAAALQRRLMDDLEHREFSGVQVLREWIQRQHAGLYAAMPVVFTSALVLGGGEAGQDGALFERFGRIVYGVSQTPQVWIDNQVMEMAGELIVNWDAVDAMFEPGVLDAMFEVYAALLKRLAEDDDCWEKNAPLCLPEKMNSVRRLPAAVPPSPARLLHEGLLEYVLRTPAAPAVIAKERTLTYQMLLAESAVVAQWLRQNGLQRGQRAGVVMHKGWEQAVAVLGVLLAGGAYMPVDAHLPIQRQEELLQLGEVRFILTQPDHSHWRLNAQFSNRFAVHEVIAPESAVTNEVTFQPAQVRPTDLAYVIFTSGTTGTPKGVMIAHQAACNTVTHINGLLGMTSADRVLGVSSLSFDLSVYDLFGVLEAGAALVLPDAERYLDAAHWRELIDRHGVTIWNSAPQLMRMLDDSFSTCDEVSQAPLRAAMLSGDWIPVNLPERLRRHYPSARVISLGGATEASIWSIYYPIRQVDPGWSSIPYGKALPGQSVQVLNAHFDECPDYVKGRIYIGGGGLADGYWGEPERTARRFICHPCSGERLYDTGDLGRYLPDGNIEFLGRDDNQVKIRGHRVEPGEVAFALRQHPGIGQAVVLPTGDRHHRQLVAYIQPSNTTLAEPVLTDAIGVRAYLASRLPDYMVPQHIVLMAKIPVTANGKVDYKALPAISDCTDAISNPVAPRSDLEKTVWDVWVQILENQNIGVTDNFFDLGGDSLTAIRIVREVCKRVDVALEIHEFLYKPTIEAISKAIEKRLSEMGSQVTTEPLMEEFVFPLSQDGSDFETANGFNCIN